MRDKKINDVLLVTFINVSFNLISSSGQRLKTLFSKFKKSMKYLRGSFPFLKINSSHVLAQKRKKDLRIY